MMMKFAFKLLVLAMMLLLAVIYGAVHVKETAQGTSPSQYSGQTADQSTPLVGNAGSGQNHVIYSNSGSLADIQQKVDKIKAEQPEKRGFSISGLCSRGFLKGVESGAHVLDQVIHISI